MKPKRRYFAKEHGKGADEIGQTRSTPRASSDLYEKGGIYRALRRSPLVGMELRITRSPADDRRVDL